MTNIHAIEYTFANPPHPDMAEWRVWRVEIGEAPAKFGGDAYEMHLWTPPHIEAEDIEAFFADPPDASVDTSTQNTTAEEKADGR